MGIPEYGPDAVKPEAEQCHATRSDEDAFAGQETMNLKELIIPPQGEGERVDRLIARYFPELPERSVRAAFLRRDVKLDGSGERNPAGNHL